MKYNRIEKCPACGHEIEISRKTKIIRKEKYYINIVCDFCSHVLPVIKKECKNEKNNLS